MSATSSAAGSDFGADDEVTSAAVGLILDSLDDIHCLLEAKVGIFYINLNDLPESELL